VKYRVKAFGSTRKTFETAEEFLRSRKNSSKCYDGSTSMYTEIADRNVLKMRLSLYLLEYSLD